MNFGNWTSHLRNQLHGVSGDDESGRSGRRELPQNDNECHDDDTDYGLQRNVRRRRLDLHLDIDQPDTENVNDREQCNHGLDDLI